MAYFGLRGMVLTISHYECMHVRLKSHAFRSLGEIVYTIIEVKSIQIHFNFSKITGPILAKTVPCSFQQT